MEIAIKKLKEIDAVAIAKAAISWMMSHLYKSAAVVIPLILLACIPSVLGAIGITASGIAASTTAVFGWHRGLD
jgi:hypothetical protein